MATTTNYGWETPDDTDLVKDGASAIRTLGSSIDTTLKAQIDAQIPDSIIDAKGDLIVGTADNTPARLAVGSNNQILTVDSTTATGLKWAAPASSIPANDSASVTTQQSTNSTSYTDLTTSGPSVTLTTGTKALVIVGAAVEAYNFEGSYMSYAVSGATTIAASDNVACGSEDGRGGIWISSKASIVTLTAGSNTFTAKYRVTNGTKNFAKRTIFVINLA